MSVFAPKADIDRNNDRTVDWSRESRESLPPTDRRHDTLDEKAQKAESEVVTRNLLYILILCVMTLGITGQAISNTMPCSSLAMTDEDRIDMADCANMVINEQRDSSTDPENCCFGDCAVMLQCSQTSATFGSNVSFQFTAVSIVSHFLVSPVEAPDSIAGIPEIRPPIIA